MKLLDAATAHTHTQHTEVDVDPEGHRHQLALERVVRARDID